MGSLLGEVKNDRGEKSYGFAQREAIRHVSRFRGRLHLLAPRTSLCLSDFLFFPFLPFSLSFLLFSLSYIVIAGLYPRSGAPSGLDTLEFTYENKLLIRTTIPRSINRHVTPNHLGRDGYLPSLPPLDYSITIFRSPYKS